MSMGSDCDDGSNPPAPASREGLLTFRAAVEAARNERRIGPAHEANDEAEEPFHGRWCEGADK